ncbi:hypothetical protein Atai01_54780 [Amycolatopsis taiwanensis]|uniref:Uncharacterized protein n=1 Tax=Amycolatopsis taiwanensis TaxID=342230 RepID=A0A9W6VIV8_9PSEU|nr:hypothetical protein Atai01_54780 [Amycolatopsis taiwanensis]
MRCGNEDDFGLPLNSSGRDDWNVDEPQDRLRMPFAIGVFVLGIAAAASLGDAWYFLTGVIAGLCLLASGP